MAYIGSPPADQASGVRPRDEFTADGTQICFPLSQSVPGSFESGVTIVLDNVPQQPVEAFTVVDTRTLTLTSISGTFTVNETITGATSAATGVVLKVNLNNIVIRGLTGTFSSSEVITGGTSAATATTTNVTINTGSGILFSEAPTVASIIYVVHEGNATYSLVPTAASVGPSQLSDNLRNFTVDTFTGNGSTTTFTLSDTPSSANSLLVMVDGIVQTRTTNYTLSGAIVTFTDAPDSSASITVIHLGFSTISRTGLVDGSVTTAKIADGSITSDKIATGGVATIDIADSAITTAKILNANVTSGKLASGVAVSNIGYTPLNKAGDTMTGSLLLPGGDGSIQRSGGNTWLMLSSNAGYGSGGVHLKLDNSSAAGGFYFFSQSASILEMAGAGKTLVLQGGSTSAGTGIAFPSTQSASSNANTLDDYEEGTWTPSVGGSATYGAQQNGWYVKVGPLVTVACDVTIATIGTGNTQLIGGLPFSAANSGGVTNGGGTVSYFAGLSVGVYSLSTQLSGTNIAFVSTTSLQATVNNTPAILTSGTRIITTISYLTSS